MERRAFLKCLCAGAAAAVAASPSQALTRLAPLGAPDGDPALTPQAGVATPDDMEQAKVEKAFGRGYWRHRRRRSRHYGGKHY